MGAQCLGAPVGQSIPQLAQTPCRDWGTLPLTILKPQPYDPGAGVMCEPYYEGDLASDTPAPQESILMQDLRTGDMVPMEDPERVKELLGQLKPIKRKIDYLQEAKNRAIPDPERQGPVFEVGEILNLKGGRFKVATIEKEGMFLKGLPLEEKPLK